jgi:hypothetical protein
MSELEKNAKERAAAYKNKTDAIEKELAERPRDSLRDENSYMDVVGRRIEEAMRAGAFDNLPGRGKPQTFKNNPFVPEDQQLAFDLLQNNALAPSWIGDRAAVLRQIEQLRTNLRHAVQRQQSRQQIASNPADRAEQWQAELRHWANEIALLNRRIGALNLQQPLAQLEVFKLSLEDELARVGYRL